MRTGTIDSAVSGPEVEVGWAPTATVPSGIAVAALMGALIGMLTLAMVNVFTAASPAFTAWVHGIGKLWMPGAEGIGPYSGKETMAAIAWLVSWALLHVGLRTRDSQALDMVRGATSFYSMSIASSSTTTSSDRRPRR